MPTGVRMPVASMSILFLIGMVQALLTPESEGLVQFGNQFVEGQPARHSLSGFRLITVSAISSGAGSVAVLARPALPNTDSTSGKVLMILSWVCNNSADLVTDKAAT